mgnify:CR=1 FL=1
MAAAPSPDVTDVAGESANLGPEGNQTRSPRDVVEYFRNQIATAKSHRRTFSGEWKRSVDLRLGRIAQINTNGYPITDGDDLQTEVNPDWYLTKTKTANLYSQTPQVQVTHENVQYAAAVAPFAKSLNYEIGEKRAKIGVPMEEVLNDVVNASGVGAIMVGYAARFEDVEMPNIDTTGFSPEQVAQMTAAGQLWMETVPRVASYQFYSKRLSPTDLLWPAAFTGSDFNDADWIGHTGKMGWAMAQTEFKLRPEDKDKVISGEQRETQDNLRAQPEKGSLMAFESVKYDEIFYWRYRVDATEKNFKSIWRMVFVHGIDTGPVIDEPWVGQQPVEGGMSTQLVGAMKFPIQVLTLTYITDNPIPPSDSAAARPQVNDLRRSRQQYFMNRMRSRPMRWFDVNRTDRVIQDSLMRGDWQGFIPTNGPGDRAIGEIARASYPPEDTAFDRQTQADMQAMWMVSPTQVGSLSSGEKTAAEITTVQANFNTRIGQERALVQKFFLNLVEVLAGLMALYSDFPNLTDNERQAMLKAWNSKAILADIVFKVRPDSTVLLDANQRIDKLTKFLNITAQSGVVNIEPVIAEIAELSGLDPAEVMKKPVPPQPEQAAISFRFSGKEDLMNPIVMALLVEQKQAPSPQSMETAEKILKASQVGMQELVPQGVSPQPEQPVPTNGEPGSPEDYSLMPKVAQRAEDMGNA